MGLCEKKDRISENGNNFFCNFEKDILLHKFSNLALGFEDRNVPCI